MIRLFGYFLLYAGLAFVAQIAFLFCLLALLLFLDLGGGGILTPILFYSYCWPLLLLPPSEGGSHGGEIFIAPVAAFLYSLIFSLILVLWRRSSGKMK